MPLERVGFVPLPSGEVPGFDHADVYQPDRRLFVAHTGADRVDVIDCAEHRYLRSLAELPGVAGVLIDESHDLLFTSDRDCARVSVFHCSDERLLGRIDVDPHPNGLAYDELRETLIALSEHSDVVGFDLVEVNPLLDVGTGITSYLAAHTIVEFLGHICAQPRWSKAHG